MRKFFLFIALIIQWEISPAKYIIGFDSLLQKKANNQIKNIGGEEVIFPDEQIAAIKKQGIATINEFYDYLNLICDKNLAPGTRKKFIDIAIKLFVSENNTVQVSSKSGRIEIIKIRTYFNRLIALPDKPFKITSYEIIFPKEFVKGEDGQYYSSSIFFLKFIESNKDYSISKITKKNVQLVIEKIKGNEGLTDKERWQLKLGDINVEETK